jgi:hypothetical protein
MYDTINALSLIIFDFRRFVLKKDLALPRSTLKDRGNFHLVYVANTDASSEVDCHHTDGHQQD